MDGSWVEEFCSVGEDVEVSGVVVGDDIWIVGEGVASWDAGKLPVTIGSLVEVGLSSISS